MSKRDDLIGLCAKFVSGVNVEMQTAYVSALMNLCDRIDPDYVVDIGTNYGTSCLALSSAMHLQGKDLSRVTTIDIRQDLWMTTRSKMADAFAKYGMDIATIQRIEKDFKQIPAVEMVQRERMMIFFDIHDHEDGSGVPNSLAFIRDWLPLLNSAIVAVHDITPCEEDWERPAEWGAPPSFAKVQSIRGQWFRGFGEAEAFIDYLSEHNVGPFVMPDTSIVWFEMENGAPR